MRRLAAHVSTLVAALVLMVVAPAPAAATWSIIAVDTNTGLVVIASATCVTGEGLRSRGGLMSIQAVIVPGVGVAAAQAGVDGTRANQTLIYEQMRAGTDPDVILDMLSTDPDFQRRQFGIVDLQGRMAGFSGSGNGHAALAVQSEIRGEGIFFAVQGNILENHDDALGREMADALIVRAKEGVDVYLLYDDVGSHSLSGDFIRRLKDAGVRVCGFNENHKFLRLLGPMRLNYRNHRKLVVVDYAQAFVGGHNVADQYVGRDAWFGHWRDTHVRVEGPAAVACSLSFVEDWLWASGEQINVPQVGEIPMPGDESVLVMPTGPADKLEECAIAFAEAASRAKTRFWVTTPYLVPSLDVQTALCAAAMRGVDVRVLLPEKRDHWTVWLASHAYEDTLVQRGVKVYRYTDGFLHQKVTLMDDDLVSIGTVNFDNRSFQINFELTLWFTHERMIGDVAAMLAEDFQHARLTWPDAFQSRSYIFRVLAQGARLLSPIL